MTGKPTVYEKADSFDRILGGASDPASVYPRIENLLRGLERQTGPDHRTRIVRQACRDLLGSGDTEEAHRFSLRSFVVGEMALLADQELFRYLFYRYRYDMFPVLKHADDFPPCLQIEPASICNLRCVFCYQTDKDFTNTRNGHMGVMSLHLFKALIDQAQGQCEAVTLASRGEPLVNPRLPEMLAYAGGKFLALKLNTNALLLNERMCHALLESGVNTLVFSVDAASEDLYAQLRVRGNFRKVVENIRRFQEIRVKHYPKSHTITRVSGVKFSEGQDLASMEAFWSDAADQVAFVKYNPWENTYMKQPGDVDTPCSDLWRRMFVWFDGRVNPCDVDYRSTMTVGSAHTDRLSVLWTGPKYSDFRRLHLSGSRKHSGLCRQCGFV